MRTGTFLELAALLACFAVGCAESHAAGGDGGPSGSGGDTGAPEHDAAMVDAPTPGPLVACGPNVCRAFEVCCNPECGVCGFPGECHDFGCGMDP